MNRSGPRRRQHRRGRLVTGILRSIWRAATVHAAAGGVTRGGAQAAST